MRQSGMGDEIHFNEWIKIPKTKPADSETEQDDFVVSVVPETDPYQPEEFNILKGIRKQAVKSKSTNKSFTKRIW
ncbi:hypothetical protein YC2023_020384 [Brassica napus]